MDHDEQGTIYAQPQRSVLSSYLRTSVLFFSIGFASVICGQYLGAQWSLLPTTQVAPLVVELPKLSPVPPPPPSQPEPHQPQPQPSSSSTPPPHPSASGTSPKSPSPVPSRAATPSRTTAPSPPSSNSRSQQPKPPAREGPNRDVPPGSPPASVPGPAPLDHVAVPAYPDLDAPSFLRSEVSYERNIDLEALLGPPIQADAAPTKPLQHCLPLHSGSTIRAFCDFVYDESTKDPTTNLPTSWDPTSVPAGSVVFAPNHMLASYFLQVHSLIPNPYVLVSGKSSDGPRDMFFPLLLPLASDAKPPPSYHDLPFTTNHWLPPRSSDGIRPTKLIAWYSANNYHIPTLPRDSHLFERAIKATTTSPQDDQLLGMAARMRSLPLGFSDTFIHNLPMEKILDAAQNAKPFWDRSKYLFVAVNPTSKPSVRGPFLETMRRLFEKENTGLPANSVIIRDVNASPRSSFDEYLAILGDSMFVPSPHGSGFDCHRTWEAVLMGAIPVVVPSENDGLARLGQRLQTFMGNVTANTGKGDLPNRSFNGEPYMSLFDSIPVLSLPSWDDLTPETLRLAAGMVREMHGGTTLTSRPGIWARTWIQRMRDDARRGVEEFRKSS